VALYIRDLDVRQINQALRTLAQRIDGMKHEVKQGRFRPNILNLPTAPPTSPKVGDVWYDVESEEIKVYKP